MVYKARRPHPPQTVLHAVVDSSPNLSSESRARYRRDLDVFVAFAGADPNSWTPTRTQAFYQSLLDRGLKPQSANRTLASVRYASKWLAATTNGYDFAIVRTAKSSKAKTFKPLNPDEAEALIMTCYGYDANTPPGYPSTQTPIDIRDCALIIVALETGMRRMSLEGMRLENFSKRPGYPIVDVPIKGHGSDLYPVPMSDTALKGLEPWRAYLRSRRITTGPVFRRVDRRVDYKTAKPYYEIGENSISNTMIHKMIAKRGHDAGIDTQRSIHPHLFRHTFSEWRRDSGVSNEHIASVTGHTLKSSIGALGGYFDISQLGMVARNTTPQWLVDLVERISR